MVYTPAVPSTHPGLTYFRDGGFDVMKRAQVLGLLTHDSKGLCFSGTHGKTTTSSMAAHILHSSEIGCNAFLGGILRNYDSNFMLSPTSPYTVIEADEFDRSFHWLNPYIAVVTATDPDHLDIYGTEEAYLESFAHFTELIQPGGTLICHTGLELRPRPQQGVAVYHYSRNEGDFHAENVRKGDGEIVFDFVSPKGTIKDVKLGVPVDINIENAVAAMAVCQLVGVPDDVMRNAVGTFLSPKRRFEFWLKESGKKRQSDYRRLRPPPRRTQGKHPLRQRLIPQPPTDRSFPAAPLHPYPRFRSAIRRSPVARRRRSAARHLPSPRASDTRSDVRNHT